MIKNQQRGKIGRLPLREKEKETIKRNLEKGKQSGSSRLFGVVCLSLIVYMNLQRF